MPSKDNMYNGRKGISFKNLSYFEKAKDLRPTLYDEKVIGLGYTLMFLTHSDEALEIEKFKRSRENKIEFAYVYGNLNASYVNEKINLEDDYFQEIINPDFDKIDSPSKEKVIVSSDSEGSEANDFNHLCSACEQGKTHRKHHKSKMAFASNKPLYLLHMDLCGPMLSQSINGKRYVLVVVDDYPRTPQQNGVVERKNRTLVEAARTMLTFANLPLFLWAKAIATACFTKNRSIIHKHFDKTPYELMNKRKPNIKFFRVFGCRCYLLNDYEDVGKLKAKGDIGVFVSYSKEYAAFKIYNKRTPLRDANCVNAMQEELDQFARLKVWRLVPRPKGKSVIKTKWIFKNKKDESSLVIRNKARLVAVGYSQQEESEYVVVSGCCAQVLWMRTQLTDYGSLYDKIQVAQKKVKKVFENADSSSRVELIPSKIKGEYSQWRERFMNYLKEQTNGEAMINSIQNDDQPLPVIAQVSLAGNAQHASPTLKDPKFWIAEEKKTQKIDLLARSLLIQGLLNDIYSLIDSNEMAKDLRNALERQMRGSEYGEQDRKAAISQTKNLMDINIDALYNILKQNKDDVNAALGYKKKVVVITSDPLALVAEKMKVSKRKEKVVVSSDYEGSGADDFSELKKITALLAKAFIRRKFYSKPINNNLRTSSTSQSANKKQEFVKSDDRKEDKKDVEKKRDMSKVKCYNCKKEGHFAKDCKKAKIKDYNYYKTKMLLAKKDSDEQVLLAKDQAWTESSSDSNQEINANI
nr:integrase, catalytic region, zinc finger, CCHC-type, peptidase aspartic, catalytic [Tanacetum cinerariifolium]